MRSGDAMPSGDNIEADTRALCLPHGRRVGQPGHDTARALVRERLGAIGLEPFSGRAFDLPYQAVAQTTGGMLEFTNLVGVIPGRDRSLAPLLVGAHYDSVIDAPCADDNATAVAVALAAAEDLVDARLARDVVVAIFDAEEPPYFRGPAMGSVRFREDHWGDRPLACALVMDLIGHDVELGMPAIESRFPPLRDLLFVLGAESHVAYPAVIERAAAGLERLPVMASLNEYIGDLSDHHAFRIAGQPFLFLSCGQGRYYHHPLDTPDWINFDKVRRVHAFVVALLRELDAAEIAGGAEPHDPAAFEIRSIERALGPVLPDLLAHLGLPALAGRSEIDVFATALAGSFRTG
ncbi:MAG: M28 family metallopeptidase [Planctomycetota bacterium]